MMKEHLRKLEFPVSLAKGSQGIGVRALPVVEISYEEDLVGVGSVLAEYPAAVNAAVQAVVDVVINRILEFSFSCNVLKGCRDYLRTVKEKIDSLDKD